MDGGLDHKATYQPALDGLRTVAVLGVVMFHARGTWFPGGYVGVDVFFVLSGYLITSVLVREHDRTGRISLRDFYRRRAVRLLPALLLVCCVVAVVFLVLPHVSRRGPTLVGTAAALTYSSSVLLAGGISDLGWMVPTWSLSVEEYFYVVWPFALWVGLRRRAGSWRRLVVGLAALALTYQLTVPTLGHWSLARVAYAPDTRAGQLLIGCALAAVQPTLRRRVPAWLVAAALLALGTFVVLPDQVTGTFYRYGGSSIVAILAGTAVAGLVGRSDESATWIQRLLSTRPMLWVGRRSYGIYLWNLPIVAVVAATPLGSGMQLLVKTALTFLIPAASYRWLELPVLGRGRRPSVVAGGGLAPVLAETRPG